MTWEKVEMKQNNMIIGKKITTILVVIFAFFIFVSVFLMPNLGQWLVAEDNLHASDMIVVLTGSVPDRILQAVDIYNARYSDKIVLVNSYRKIPLGSAQLSKMAAIDVRVPEENILILEGNAKSTQDEALIIREYIRNNREIESIILVTSKYHSRRSNKIFTKALSYLDREISIYSSPSKYDLFNANQWWRDREDIESVISEYVKLVHFYFWEQFSLD